MKGCIPWEGCHAGAEKQRAGRSSREELLWTDHNPTLSYHP